MSTIRIAGIEEESIVDGPGIRFVVFTQGCKHNCKGCQNPETHSFSGGSSMEIDDIIEKIKENPLLKGITLSGGEPFEQPKACLALAKKVKKLGLDVCCYTGYTLEEILRDEAKKELVSEIDTLIDGRFIIEEKNLLLKFRGSENQRMINMNEYMTAWN